MGDLLRTMQDEMPLVEPSYAESHGDEQQKLLSVRVAENILQRTGLRSSLRHCARWLSVGCDDASLAISMMRLLAVRNVVVHCEGTLLYVPLNTSVDPSGTMTAALITSTYQMAR
ncbi:hypothetical protein [Acidipila sp. EB88]|uniref:hypothetical protein n=1 Tax=Acidipila sp. EB88 TaxID=2305226 RepID=UPI000F5FC910|nr:hypothetical protein [Acidipila sp. EB88]